MLHKYNKILVVHDYADCGGSYSELLSEFGEVTRDVAALKLRPFEFKLVFFTGGEDVTPELYGDTSPKNLCCSNPKRDKDEVEIFKFCSNRGMKMAGICRGMQFLNVMCGGKMVHHMEGHAGYHDIRTTSDTPSWRSMRVNSTHHQMAIPATTTRVLAWAEPRLSKVYIGDKDEKMGWPGLETEAIYDSTNKVMGVQWHPETLGKDHKARRYFSDLLMDFLKSTPYVFKARNLPNTEIEVLRSESSVVSR